MSFSAKDWSRQYESVKNTVRTKRCQGEVFNNAEIKYITSTLKTLEGQLRTMENSPLEYEIVASEICRRQVLLDSLHKRLFGGSSASSSEISPTVTAPTSSKFDKNSHLGTSDKGLMMQQMNTMQQQDEMLLDIEKGVGRLHGQAKAIGEESKLHTRLLDELDTDVSDATEGLHAEAQHASKIKEQSKVCYMYICIVVEVIILLMLIILAFA